MDLTVECIRRHYNGDAGSPLSAVLGRYCEFFKLFGSFQGYVDFFLLQDLVAPDYSSVRFFTPFSGFEARPLPATLVDYRTYCARATALIEARKARMRESISLPAMDAAAG